MTKTSTLSVLPWILPVFIKYRVLGEKELSIELCLVGFKRNITYMAVFQSFIKASSSKYCIYV